MAEGLALSHQLRALWEMGATAVGPRNQGGGRLLKRKLCRQQLPPAPQYIPGTRYMLKIPKYLLGSHLLHI